MTGFVAVECRECTFAEVVCNEQDHGKWRWCPSCGHTGTLVLRASNRDGSKPTTLDDHF